MLDTEVAKGGRSGTGVHVNTQRLALGESRGLVTSLLPASWVSLGGTPPFPGPQFLHLYHEAAG